MKKVVLNYRILVEKELDEKNRPVYVTQVPTLGISDFGKTVEEALKNTEKIIKFHVECLAAEQKAIPHPDNPQEIIVTNKEIEISSKKALTFA